MAKYLVEVSGSRKNNFNFVRLVLACAVIYGHSYAVTRDGGADWVTKLTGYAFAGGVAVDIFFLISGFLVTASVVERGVFRYLVSRGLGVYPALLVNMAVMVLLVAPLVTSLPLADYVASGSVWNYFFSLITTAKAMFFLPGVFADHRDAAVNGSIWSVLIEVRLYLILAVLYILGILKSAGRYNAVFFGMVFLFWMNPDWLPRFAQGARNAHVCFLFFVGVFLYMNREYVPLGGYWMLPGLLLCGMTLGTPGFPFAYMLLLTAIFVATCFGSGLAGFGRFGDLSYGVYLYGWPVQQLVVEAWPGVSALVNTCVSIGISLLIAYFSWRFVEEPALRLKAGLLQLPLHFFRARRPQTSYGEVLESSKSD